MAQLFYSRKRVLVTGRVGFIGSHLCDRLLGQGREMLCMDNLFTGTKRNVEHLLNHPRFKFLRHDVTFLLYVEVDELYNSACPASPVHYQHDPVKTTKTSVHGAINALGLAKRLRCPILDLAEMVKRMTGSRSKPIHRAWPSDDPLQRRPDITRAQTRLEWQPTVPLVEAMGETLGNFWELFPVQMARAGS